MSPTESNMIYIYTEKGVTMQLGGVKLGNLDARPTTTGHAWPCNLHANIDVLILDLLFRSDS